MIFVSVPKVLVSVNLSHQMDRLVHAFYVEH